MFDIGFSELLVIAVVALVVLGPERLPRVARTAGALLGRFQRYVNEVKSEVRREMELEDLKKLQAQVTEQIHEVENTIHKEVHSLETATQEVAKEVRTAVEGDAASVPPVTAAAPPADVAATAAPHDKPAEKSA